MRILIIILLCCLSDYAIAQNAVCNGTDQLISTNVNGNADCQGNGFTYTKDSVATATAKSQGQAILDAQNQSNQQQQILIQQDMQNLAIQDLQSQGLLTQDQATSAQASLTTLQSAQTLQAKTGGLGATSVTTNSSN